MTTETTTAETTGGLQETARELASDVGQTAERQADSAMRRAGSTVREVASAIRTASDDLTEQQPQIGRFADLAATRLDDAAAYLDEHQPAEVLEEAQRLARRQPAIVIAGGLALGLVLGRVLRTASRPASGSASDRDWYAQGYRGTSGTGNGRGSSYPSGDGATFGTASAADVPS